MPSSLIVSSTSKSDAKTLSGIYCLYTYTQSATVPYLKEEPSYFSANLEIYSVISPSCSSISISSFID